MPYISVTYTITNGRKLDETLLNKNFTDIVEGLSDGTKNLQVNDGIITGQLNSLNATLDGSSSVGGNLSCSGTSLFSANLTCSDDVTTKVLGFTTAETNTISSTSTVTPTKSLVNLNAIIYNAAEFDSIEIDATNNKLDFKEGSGAEQTATITSGTYIPAALATEIETQLNATSSLLWTCVYSATYKFYITSESASSILWYSGTNTATTIGKNIGFDIMSDDTSETSYTSDYQYQIRYGNELATITATNFSEGAFVVFKLSTSSLSNTITIKDGTGNINCGSDKTLNSSSNYMLLYDGTNFNLIA